MVALQNTRDFGNLLSTQRCAGVLCKQVESIFVSIQMMLIFQLKNCRKWVKQRMNHFLIVFYIMPSAYVAQDSTGSSSEVDSLRWWTLFGLPTVFFTHSAADLWWPELVHLICPDNQDPSSAHIKAVQENPAIADWFFYQRMVKFIDAFYTRVLGATNYWFRFEWQHRGSPHVHGLAWVPNAPDVEQILTSTDITATKEALIEYVNKIISTTNPAVLPDGSNIDEVPAPKTDPHICNLPYMEVEDFDQDLADLIATCQ